MSRLRLRLSQCATVIGLALAAVLLWRAFFDTNWRFDSLTMAVGLTGLGAAALAGRCPRTAVDGPVAIFIGVSLLSVFWHAGQHETFLDPPEVFWRWQPAFHLAAWLAYFYGLTALLSTQRRVGAVVASVVVAVSIIAVLVIYDRILLGWEGRPLDYMSINQWTGYAGIGLVFCLGLPLPAAVLLTSRSRAARLAAAVVTTALLIATILVDSRSAIVAIAAACLAIAAVEIWRLGQLRLAAVLVLVVAVGAVVPLARPKEDTLAVSLMTRRVPVMLQTMTARANMWLATLDMIRDQVWLGVGPGNYTDELQRRNVGNSDVLPFANHAHNMILHVTAESGLVAAGAFVVLWWRILKRLAELSNRSFLGALALALFGALFAFFVRSLSDHFFWGLYVSERTGVLVWTLLAAAAAVIELSTPTGGRA